MRIVWQGQRGLEQLRLGAAGMALCGLVLAVTPARADTAAATIDFDTRSLATTLWYPDGLDVIRGVLVFTGGQEPGHSGDTRGIVDDPFWRRFAAGFGFALLGNQFTGLYVDAAAGPGQALVDALAALGLVTGHSELARAPITLEGFSNGGYFSFSFTQFAPARVIAFCVNKSGYATAPLDAALLATPGLLIWGADEPGTGTPTIIHALVEQGRAQHALWAEVREWGVAHAEGEAQRLFAPFFADMIAARYPAAVSPRDAEVPLLALVEEAGWLADHSDASVSAELPSIARFTDYAADRQKASWMPSQSMAQLWRGFVTKTPLTLERPAAGAQLEIGSVAQLSAAGLGDGLNARFMLGSATLAPAVAASGGRATFDWMPSVPGASAVLALEVNVIGAVTRTSRPAAIVSYPRALPPPMLDAGLPDAAPAADGGSDAGAQRPDSAQPDAAAVSDNDAGGIARDAQPDSSETQTDGQARDGDGGVHRHAATQLRGGQHSRGGCQLAAGTAARSRAPGAFTIALLALALWRMRLSRARLHARRDTKSH